MGARTGYFLCVVAVAIPIFSLLTREEKLRPPDDAGHARVLRDIKVRKAGPRVHARLRTADRIAANVLQARAAAERLAWLHDDERVDLQSALDSLGKVGPPAGAAAPALEDLLLHDDVRIRVRAAAALWRVSGETIPAVTYLVRALDVSDRLNYIPRRSDLRLQGPPRSASFRMRAVKVLGDMRAPQAARPLQKIAESPDEPKRLRAAAERAIEKISGP